MARFRVIATVSCSKRLIRILPFKLRGEVRKLKALGLELELESIEVEPL